MSNTLYDITADLARLFDLHASGEIDDQTLADTLDAGLKDDEAAKLESYAFAIKHSELDADLLNAQAKVLKEEADRLTAKAKARENTATRMKERVCAHLLATGQEKAKAGLFSWSIKRTKSVQIDGDVPTAYARIKVEPDKVKIKEAIESGNAVPGASLVERTTAVLR